MLEIILCDDNEHFLNNTVKIANKIIERNRMNAKVVFTACTPQQVEQYLSHGSANVFFLDIDLKAAETGYTLAKKIREIHPHAYIVFISAHLEYLLQAFKVQAFDFLPKPVTADILDQCLQTISTHYNQQIISNKNSERIEIKVGSNIHRLKTKDIFYIEKAADKTNINLCNTFIACTYTLETLESLLPDDIFIRCHRSFIVNKNYISELRLKNNEVLLENGSVCFIGRKYKPQVLNLFELSEQL